MKTATSFVAAAVLLLVFRLTAFAQPPTPPQPDLPPATPATPASDGQTQPAASPAAAATFDTGFVYEQLKLTNPDELMRRVELAFNALGRDGQEALKDRARVRLAREKAQAVVDRNKANPEIARVEEAINADAAQGELSALIEIKDKDRQVTAFSEFLKRIGVSAESLRGLAELRTAEDVLKAGQETIELINKYLERPTLPVTVSAEVAAGDALDSIRKINAKYGGKTPVPGIQAAGTDGGEDLLPLLRALLRRPPQPQSPPADSSQPTRPNVP